MNKEHLTQVRSTTSIILSIVMLLSNTLAAFADSPTVSSKESKYYRQYIATPLDVYYYKISENILSTPTSEVSSCSIYGPGSVSTPGETGDSPELCWVAGEWSECSNTCGSGTSTRDVKCVDMFNTNSSGCEESLKLSETNNCEEFTDCQYVWDYSVWGACSSLCGEGTKTRTATCERTNGTTVSDSYCTEQPVLTESCSDTSSCIYDWEYSEWSMCSTSCGTGVQDRSSACKSNIGITVDDSMCSNERISSQSCFSTSTCKFVWDTTTWSDCSTSCGAGIQTREMTCKRSDGTIVVDELCPPRPEGSQSCINISSCAYSWDTTDWGSCSNTCGTGTQTRVSTCKRSDGTTVADTLCPAKPSGSQACTDISTCTYAWNTTAWDSCSTTCGAGTQSRTSTCERSDGTTVLDSFCPAKPSNSQACTDISTCTHSWNTTSWGGCSNTCGTGTQTRTSTCKRSDGVTVSDVLCPAKPAVSQSCTDISTCTYNWNTTAWGSCSTTCGTGTQTRTSICKRSDGTTVADALCPAKPAGSQPCTNTSTCTYSWNTTSWGSCSNTCGAGTQTRTSTCKRSDGATVADTSCPAKPAGSQSCTNTSTCTYSWNTTTWGSCSATCGTGTQTRTSTCKRSDGTTVVDSLCPVKPASSQSCTSTSGCTYSWNTSAWGSCSKSCGTGTQSRTSICKRSDGITVANASCGTRPSLTQSCTVYSGCTYTPSYSAYGNCSATCPSSTKSRTAQCWRSDGALVSNSYCSLSAMTIACSCTTGCYDRDIYYFANGSRVNRSKECKGFSSCNLKNNTYSCTIFFGGGGGGDDSGPNSSD